MIMSLLKPFKTDYESGHFDIAMLLLRLTFGGLMLLNHGWGKMIKLFTEDPIRFADPIGIGMAPSLALTVFAEALCAFLIVIGLGTRLATIPLIITMLVAVFVIHWADPFGDKEMALLYLIPYLAILLMGPGKISLDSMIKSKS